MPLPHLSSSLLTLSFQPPPPAGGPPYPPQTAQLGLVPSPVPDIPVSVVLLLLFIAAAAANMTVFQLNRHRSYKFLFSALLCAFCVARVVALALRCVWAVHPHNVRVAIAAQIFTAAGVLILFITNLVFAQRVVRAYHPFFGWSKGVTWLFWGLFGSAGAVLVMVVAVTVQGFFAAPGAAGEEVRGVDKKVQLFCVVYLALYAFLPVPLVTLAAVVPRRTRIDKFGEGHFRTKFALLTFTASLLAVGAVFRAVVAFETRPVAHPAWFHGKACYYCFNYGVELVVVFTYALSRFDKRFHIPDGSSAPGHYSCAESGTALVSNADFARRRRGKRVAVGGAQGSQAPLSQPWMTAATTPSIKSSKSVRTLIRAASSCYGEGTSESSQVQRANLEWMNKAMVSFPSPRLF
ncbi:hypothetical protein C8A01DRAFT_14555 [Parachaetomium inaequale]|uniref:Uncharacterized protein n=1 Tax=Parachaetomium inaequale TaxID=2588326 RepID=A0AAN6STH5_9PEZI|nr:hypothetical protein C8A01DRAFT_14555 [Parachaetomium inaequale]